MRGLVLAITLQWVSGALLVALVYALFGFLSFFPIPAGLFIGALLYFLKVALPPLTREDVRRISKWTGASSVLIVTLLYWGLFTLMPQSFGFSWQEVLWLAPCLGFGAGLVTLICTLIAGDTVATIRSEALS